MKGKEHALDHPFLIGKKLYLRALEKSDINEHYLRWINDPEVTKYMITGTFPSNMEKLEEYYHRMSTSANHVILSVIAKDSNKHIGNITLNDINWIDRTANLGIMIGEKDCWGKGYSTEAIKLLIQYSFDRLNLNRLTIWAYASNKAAIRVYEKAGFKAEGYLKNDLYRDGKYHDRIVMGLIRENAVKKEDKEKSEVKGNR